MLDLIHLWTLRRPLIQRVPHLLTECLDGGLVCGEELVFDGGVHVYAGARDTLGIIELELDVRDGGREEGDVRFAPSSP